MKKNILLDFSDNLILFFKFYKIILFFIKFQNYALQIKIKFSVLNFLNYFFMLFLKKIILIYILNTLNQLN